MNFTVENINSVKKKVVVEIPANEAARALDEAYNELKGSVTIKGFRPGKVPRAVLERRYGKNIQQEVGSKLLQDSWVDFVRENQLAMAGPPEINLGGFDASGAYTYSAVIEVFPEIADIDLKSLELIKPIYQVTEAEVEKQLETQQQFLAEKRPLAVPRPVASNDLILLDYEGFKDGQPFSGTPKLSNDTLRVGRSRILPDFDHQLLGMEPGSTREITVNFPEEYPKSEMAGQQITFQVTLHHILEEILPPLDDAFARQLGDYATLEELKEAIRKDLQAGYEQRSEQELQEAAHQALLDRVQFDVPEALIKAELEFISQDIQKMFKFQNLSEEQGPTPEMVEQRYRGLAEKQARRHLILKKIIEQEKLTLPDEALEKAYQDIHAMNQKPLDEIRAFFTSNSDKAESLKYTLLEKEALQKVIQISAVKQVATPLQTSE